MVFFYVANWKTKLQGLGNYLFDKNKVGVIKTLAFIFLLNEYIMSLFIETGLSVCISIYLDKETPISN